MIAPLWLPKIFILRVHDRQIELFGGLPGIRDEGLLESALARPVNAFNYGEHDPFSLAGLYAAGIIKNHPFLDGNKRTGYVAALTFLRALAWRLTAPDEDRIAKTLLLAAGDIDARAYADWLRGACVQKAG